MPYAHRPIHDADAHFVETPEWFHEFADPDVRAKLKPVYVATVKRTAGFEGTQMRRLC